ncbi:MAG TPA: Ig-like domain-containing protein [Gemmatimonadales bacterium]|jgi:hypothetical protein
MFKFYRTALVAGAVALGLAACGDDVTVGNGGSTRGVTSVNVTPANASVAIGQTLTLSASVIADSGVSTAVDWVSSNPTIATVNGVGAVTGVAVGTTTIIAKSHVDTTRQAAVQLTVLAAVPGITSFSITPTTMTLAPGQSSQALANIQTAAGVTAPPVTWTSLTPAIATVSSTGLITGVAQGSAVVTGAITSGGVTLTGSVNVTVGQGASVSIASITVGGTNGIPVNISNVAGQVDVNMNLNAGVQSLDSLNVYVQENGVNRRLATQSYGNSIPSAGPVTLSINTANFVKNKTTGTALVDIFNGPGTFVVRVFPHSTAGGSVTNCQVGANDPNCSHPQSVIFNNVDGFAADNIKPARSATDSDGNGNATGSTYWGGPGAMGADSAILYPIIYDSLGNGRTVTNVSWGIGSGILSCDVTHTFAVGAYNGHNVFASGVTGDSDCTGHQNILTHRDNILVHGAQDNLGNPFPTHLIANLVVNGATPDSLRIDWAGPSDVQRPAGEGWEGQHWVNANWQFNHFGTEVEDGGVGPAPSTWLAYVGPAYTTVITTGASLAETNTNTTDGYTARATAADRLGNLSHSAVTTTFGVDKTAPVLRYSAVAAPSSYTASIYVGGGAATVLDSTTYNAVQGLYSANITTAGAQDLFLGAAAGTNDSVRAESRDDRAGNFRGIETVNRFAQGGATGTTTSVVAVNFTIQDANNTSIGFLPGTVDGYLPLHAQGVTGGSSTPGYYTSTVYSVDKAGNASGCPVARATDGANGAACTPPATAAGFVRRTLALDPGTPQVTGVSPNNSYVGNSSVIFTLGSQNDLEVIDAKLRLLYPSLTEGDVAGTIPAAGAGGLVWTYALSNTLLGSGFSAGPASGNGTNFGYFAPIGTRFDNSIINPSTTPLTLDLFITNIQETCTSATTGFATGPTTAAACVSPKAVGDPIPTTGAGSIVHAIPSNVGVQVRDVFGSWIFNTVSSTVATHATGVSDEFVSPILSATVDTSRIANTSYGVTYFDPGLGQSCPMGGAVQPAGTATCVSGGINFRADNTLTTAGTKVFRATERLSNTLPIFGRVDLFGLNAQFQWVFIGRITVPATVLGASCPAGTPTTQGVVGCDNGLERYWLYTFTSVPAGFSEYRAIGVDGVGSGLASTVHN